MGGSWGVRAGDLGLMCTVLLGSGPHVTPGASEEKPGLLEHWGLPRRPLPSESWSLCLCAIKTDKRGLTAEFQTECLMQLMHIS